MITQLVPFKVKFNMPPRESRIRLVNTSEVYASNEVEKKAEDEWNKRIDSLYEPFLNKEWTVVGCRVNGIIDEFLLVRGGELTRWARQENCEAISL